LREDSYLDDKEFKIILTKYEKARKLNQPIYLEADELTDIAEYYHSIGKEEDANIAVDLALSFFPGSISPLIYKARLSLLTNDDPSIANEYLEQISDKTDLDYYYMKAEILIASDREDEADSFLKETYKTLEDDDRKDYIFDIANLYIDYDLFEYANNWLNLSDDKKSTDYRELLGRVLCNKGQFKQSEVIFRELLEEEPYSTTYWDTLASIQFFQENIKDSITSSEYSIAIDPNNYEAILNKANGLYTLENYEDALKYFNRYIKLQPNDGVGEILLATTLINLGKFNDAVTHLKRAEELCVTSKSNLMEIYQKMAISLSLIGDLSQASTCLDKTNTLDCNHNEIMVLKGHIFLENNKIDEAKKCFHSALYNSHFDKNIFYRIALSVYDNNYKKIAYRMLKYLVNSFGDEWIEGYAYLAKCAREIGKNNEFLIYLKKACQINPKEAKMVLGDLFPSDIEPKDYFNYIISNN
jgi:tetratricopeptide (TPR) repeat protein